VSRSNGHWSPIQSLDHIAELAQTLAPLLEDAADAGARKSSDGPGFVGRGRGFTDTDPTGTAALDPRRSQIRQTARRATHLIYEAEATLEEASGVIANGRYGVLDGMNRRKLTGRPTGEPRRTPTVPGQQMRAQSRRLRHLAGDVGVRVRHRHVRGLHDGERASLTIRALERGARLPDGKLQQLVGSVGGALLAHDVICKAPLGHSAVAQQASSGAVQAVGARPLGPCWSGGRLHY
jgi:hypothetical protein